MNNTLDLSNIPKEVLFLLEILKENEDGVNQRRLEILSEEIDWNLFLDYSIHHRVYPVLYSKIKHLYTCKIPSSIIHSLEQLYKQNTLKMLQLSGEMEQISRWFAEEGIDTLFLKGPAVAHELYGDISFRTSKDLDFLISIEHLDKAEHILKKQGYEKNETGLFFYEWKWRNHHVSFYHREKGIEVEVHWRLHPFPEKEANFIDLWKRSKKSSLTNYPVHILGREDLCHFLVLHGARHGWFRLRWLLDVQQILKASVDWELTYKLFESSHNVKLAGQAIILESQLLNINISKVNNLFIKDMRSRALAQEAIFFIERMEKFELSLKNNSIKNSDFQYFLSLKSTISQQIFVFLNFLLPTKVDVETLPLPKRLYFLYFLLRPFLWSWRKIKQIRVSSGES